MKIAKHHRECNANDLLSDLVSAGGREESREPVEQRPQVHVVRGRRCQVRLDEEVDVVAADGRVGVPRHEAPQVGGQTLRPGKPFRDSMDHEHSRTNQAMEERLMQLTKVLSHELKQQPKPWLN